MKGKYKVVHVNAMEAYRRNRGMTPLILNLDTGQLHAPDPQPLYPLNRNTCGPQNWSGRFGEEIIF